MDKIENLCNKIWGWGLLFPFAIQTLRLLWEVALIQESKGFLDIPTAKLVIGAFTGLLWYLFWNFLTKETLNSFLETPIKELTNEEKMV